mgnify:CR=1 FL=1
MTSNSIMDEYSKKILKTLLKNPDRSYTKKHLAEQSGVSREALYARWDQIQKLGIIKEDRHKYTLDRTAELSQTLADLIVKIENK